LLLNQHTRVIAVPLLAFAVIGFVEDIRGIPIVWRLALQAIAGLGSAMAITPSPSAVVASLGVTIWLVAYANVFNFMDGVNGISAFNAILGGLVYAAIGWTQQMPTLTYGGLILAAAAITFLPWNAGRAKIFLGDVGSYGLGGLLGALAAYSVLRGIPAEAALAPLALYIADTGWTLFKRWRRGEIWYLPHRSHTYQKLTIIGWSHQRVAAFTAILGLSVSCCAAASFSNSPTLRILLDAFAASLLIGYLITPAILTRKGYPQEESAAIEPEPVGPNN
jgi:UDP-GlcNAc:undecaprenyl-phosphate GlcNAc-1-phosphate transferase